jgi:hypothetical protein
MAISPSLLAGVVLVAQDMPSDPGVDLPWFLVVGGGVVVVLGGYALLFVMLKFFPRGRRLDQGKKPAEPVHPKKTCPRVDWPLPEIEESNESDKEA